MPPELIYRAFISYSHADSDAAARWFDWLRAADIPAPFAGMCTRLGLVPEHLRPVCRDRLNFSPGKELSAQTRQHLDQSWTLVLLASPASAASAYVNEEVRYFRWMYPDRPIVPVLIGPADAAFRTMLPPALAFTLDTAGNVTDVEYNLIAVDPRPEGDGPLMALAKLVGQLVGFDDDLQRQWVEFELNRAKSAEQKKDQEQRGQADHRRAQGITIVIALLGAMVAGSWWAARKDHAQEAIVPAIQRIETMQRAILTGEGPASIQAVAEFRALLRRFAPDIDMVPAEKLPTLLLRILTTLRTPGVDPNDFAGAVREALRQAKDRINQLDFVGAASVLDAELARSEAQARDRAALLAERGRVARLQLKYRESARFYRQASDAVAFDPQMAWSYEMSAADVLYDQGNEFGDNEALHEAIVTYHTTLRRAPRDSRRDDWASTQYNLGIALRTFGRRESNATRLEEAIAASRAALEERTRERLPLEWAAAQNSLGVALRALGERETGTTRLEAAVTSLRLALEERTRERVPLDWAETQNDLGTALTTLAERESGTARLMEAVGTLHLALEERTRERVPLDWARTQANLGTALTILGGREIGNARLEDAVAALRLALEKTARERVPLDWAGLQNNLGIALAILGGRESSIARVEEGVATLRLALEERTRERVPLEWAATQSSLGYALSMLGDLQSSTTLLPEAVATLRLALEERTRERVPPDWAGTQINLGIALGTLGKIESSTARLEEAVATFRLALEATPRERMPRDWAGTQAELGIALRTLGGIESSAARLEEAVATFRLALEETTREHAPREWVAIQANLGIALGTLGGIESSIARLEEAVAAFRLALEETPRERMPRDWVSSQINLGIALRTLGERESITARLEEAVATFRLALEETTRERAPRDWVEIQVDLALALWRLGDREGGTARLEEAAKLVRSALHVCENDARLILCVIHRRYHQSIVQAIAARHSGLWVLQQRVDAARRDLASSSRDDAPSEWANAQLDLADALAKIGEQLGSPGHLEEAIARADAVIEIYKEWQSTERAVALGTRVAELKAKLTDWSTR